MPILPTFLPLVQKSDIYLSTVLTGLKLPAWKYVHWRVSVSVAVRSSYRGGDELLGCGYRFQDAPAQRKIRRYRRRQRASGPVRRLGIYVFRPESVDRSVRGEKMIDGFTRLLPALGKVPAFYQHTCRAETQDLLGCRFDIRRGTNFDA